MRSYSLETLLFLIARLMIDLTVPNTLLMVSLAIP